MATSTSSPSNTSPVNAQGFRTRPETSSTTSYPRLGNWQIVRKVGEGSTAEIYLAIPHDASRESKSYYALKLLRDQWQEQPLVLNQFRREGALSRRISHPHIISAVSARLEESPYFFVMPFLRGASLDKHLQQKCRISLPITLGIVRQAASAVTELHRLKLLHNDIKPANIFVNDDGHTTLLDLGSIREFDEAGNIFQRPILGAAAYMAPEQFTSSYCINEASDLYSFGVILYQAISGRLPINGSSLEQFATNAKIEQPIPLRQLCPTITVELAELIHSLLAKSPARRFDNAARLVQELAKHEIASLNQFWPDDFLEIVIDEPENIQLF